MSGQENGVIPSAARDLSRRRRKVVGASREPCDVVGDYFQNVAAGIAEDAGHFVRDETPDPAAREIDRFFRRIGYRAP